MSDFQPKAGVRAEERWEGGGGGEGEGERILDNVLNFKERALWLKQRYTDIPLEWSPS